MRNTPVVEKQGQLGDGYTKYFKKIFLEMATIDVGTWMRGIFVTIRNQSRHYRQKSYQFNNKAFRCCRKATCRDTLCCLAASKLTGAGNSHRRATFATGE
jgi:hypothetical protein